MKCRIQTCETWQQQLDPPQAVVDFLNLAFLVTVTGGIVALLISQRREVLGKAPIVGEIEIASLRSQ